MSRRTRRAGTTLVELLITLSVMGVIMGVATMAVRRIEAPRPDDPYQIVEDSLRRAVAIGRGTTIKLMVRGLPALVTVNPDGSVVADSALGIERFTGRMPRVR